MSLPNPLHPLDEHNQTLAANVHPAHWMHVLPTGRYQLVVIGAGTAGLVSAAGAAGLGAKVALIEKELMGGDCLNVGCVPSKALLRAARAAAAVRDAGAFGVAVDGYRVNFPAVMERMRRLRANLSVHDSAVRFQNLGVDVFFGAARFLGPDALAVGGQTLRFRRAILATGARAAALPIPGLAEAGFLTNESVFSLTELPRRLAVIGAGPIGCELAQAFARFGAAVTLLSDGNQVLPREDADAAALVASALNRDGVQLLLRSKVVRVETRGSEKVLHSESDGQPREIVADALLLGVGRAPNVQGLDLAAAGVSYDEKDGVQVNDRLRTANPRIYAAGDICSRFKFTHAADALARIAIQNALFPLIKGRASALTIPWCTYTDPEVAHVGLNEHEARQRRIPVQTITQDMAQVDRAVLDGDEAGFARIHVRAGSDRILGATIVARHAGEMISELTLAMTAKLGLRALARTIHPYPTQADALRKLGDAYNRTRFTGLVQWLLQRWLAWTR